LAFPKVRLVIDLVLENVSGKYFDGLLRLRPSLGKEISQGAPGRGITVYRCRPD
jgi:hypothetical protein